MKKFNLKSLVIGLVIGSIGATTVVAADATLLFSRGASVRLDGAAVNLVNPLVKANDTLYVPAKELLEHLGYAVEWDYERDVLNIISDNRALPSERAIDLQNRASQRNISESGSFRAASGQTLTLDITSNITGGSVDLFLFNPAGVEQRITIWGNDTTKEIPLTEGVWQFNAFGIFRGGSISIVGIIE